MIAASLKNHMSLLVYEHLGILRERSREAVGDGRALPLRFCPPTRQFQAEQLAAATGPCILQWIWSVRSKVKRQQLERLDQLCASAQNQCFCHEVVLHSSVSRTELTSRYILRWIGR